MRRLSSQSVLKCARLDRMAKEVIVKLKNDQGFSSPSQDIRQILMIELKGFFANDLQVEASPWRDLVARDGKSGRNGRHACAIFLNWC